MLKEVSKEDFYKIIGSQDLIVVTDGTYKGSKYPYNAYFKTKGGTTKGVIKPILNELGQEKYPIKNKYFINN